MPAVQGYYTINHSYYHLGLLLSSISSVGFAAYSPWKMESGKSPSPGTDQTILRVVTSRC